MHTVLLSQADKVLETKDTFEAPPEEAYDEEKDNLQSWLLQPECYDQFIAHHNNKFTVAYNARDAPIIVEERVVRTAWRRSEWSFLYRIASPPFGPCRPLRLRTGQICPKCGHRRARTWQRCT